MLIQLRSRILCSLSLCVLAIPAASFAKEATTMARLHGRERLRVTVSNVMARNLLSPFLVVALQSGSELFSAGQPATVGIATVAETGNTAPLEAELAQNPHVIASSKAAGGPLSAGESRSVEIEVDSQAIRQGATLNLVAMIGRSNDSFIAISKLRLSNIIYAGAVHVAAVNYDAGSEANSGNLADFGPGGHPTTDAEGMVSVDRGLNLRGDAPEVLGWGSVAARVTVEQL